MNYHIPDGILPRLFALLLVVGNFSPSCAHADQSANSGARIVFAGSDFDFGKVDPGTSVKHDYVLTNAGEQVLTIADVLPTCDCTSVGNYDKNIPPGQTGVISIEFNSRGVAGPVQKSVLVSCNDPSRPEVALTFHGVVEKLFDLSPQFLVFNLPPEGWSNQTQIVRIVSHSDRAETVFEPTCGNRAFKTELKTVREGKEFELRVTLVASNLSGNISAPISLKTSSEKMPSLSIVAVAAIQPIFSLKPSQLALPTNPLLEATQLSVTIQNNAVSLVTLSEPTISAVGVEARLTELNPGRLFKLSVSFPAGFKSETGVQVSLKSNHPKFPVINIPVHQPDPQ